MKEQLKEILEAFKWTFDNMGTSHTPDHFNIPTNGIKMLEDLIDTNNKNNNPIRDYEFLFKCLEQELKIKEALLEWNQSQREKLVEQNYVLNNEKNSIILLLKTLYDAYYFDAKKPTEEDEDEIYMILSCAGLV